MPSDLTRPVACALPPADLEARIAHLRGTLAGRILERRHLSNGVAARFPEDPDTRAQLEEFIAFERECCAFASFELTAAGEGSLWLEVRGPEGTRDLFVGLLEGSDVRPGSQARGLRRMGLFRRLFGSCAC